MMPHASANILATSSIVDQPAPIQSAISSLPAADRFATKEDFLQHCTLLQRHGAHDMISDFFPQFDGLRPELKPCLKISTARKSNPRLEEIARAMSRDLQVIIVLAFNVPQHSTQEIKGAKKESGQGESVKDSEEDTKEKIGFLSTLSIGCADQKGDEPLCQSQFHILAKRAKGYRNVLDIETKLIVASLQPSVTRTISHVSLMFEPTMTNHVTSSITADCEALRGTRQSSFSRLLSFASGLSGKDLVATASGTGAWGKQKQVTLPANRFYTLQQVVPERFDYRNRFELRHTNRSGSASSASDKVNAIAKVNTSLVLEPGLQIPNVSMWATTQTKYKVALSAFDGSSHHIIDKHTTYIHDLLDERGFETTAELDFDSTFQRVEIRNPAHRGTESAGLCSVSHLNTDRASLSTTRKASGFPRLHRAFTGPAPISYKVFAPVNDQVKNMTASEMSSALRRVLGMCDGHNGFAGPAVRNGVWAAQGHVSIPVQKAESVQVDAL